MIMGGEMDKNEQVVSVEWVLIALLSVFALSSAISILILTSLFAFIADISVFDAISVEFITGPIMGSGYWLIGVGALWFLAHRLRYRRWWALMVIGAVVSIGMTVAFNAAHLDVFWLVVNAVISSAMGWVLWRLAYRQAVSDLSAAPRPNLGEYQTTIGRVLLALFCGSLVGSGASVVVVFEIFGREAYRGSQEIIVLLIGFWFSSVFVLGGISIAVLHNIGVRQWYGLTIVGGLSMLSAIQIMFRDHVELEFILIMVAISSAVGWVVRRVAYRRAVLEG